MRPILEQLQARAEGGEDLDPQLHANLAIELGAAGLDRERAIRHARAAVRATPRLMSLTSTALPEAVTVLLFAGPAARPRGRADVAAAGAAAGMAAGVGDRRLGGVADRAV